MHGARGTPVVGPGALGFIDRAGRGVNAAHLRAAHRGGKAAEHIAGALRLLALEQLMLARHRQTRQRSA
jgi:hypothetical protein